MSGSQSQFNCVKLMAPKCRSFPGDECLLDYGALTGDASAQSSGDFAGTRKVQHSTEPPHFLKIRTDVGKGKLSNELRSSILARTYTVGSVHGDQRTTIEPLDWANVVRSELVGKKAYKETLSIVNLSAVLPGMTNIRFLNSSCLIALPHCVACDVRTVRPGKVKTPENVLSSQADAQEEPRFSTDVPEVFYIQIHLGYKNSTVSVESMTYHTITPFVKRPHAFTCVENRSLTDRSSSRRAQYMIVGGELMPACAGSTETVIGVHFINLSSHELEHSVALSTDTVGDMISSIELALLPQTVIVTLRYGGIYVLQSGRIAHHIPAPYSTYGCLASCSALDPQFIAARGLTGKYYLKSLFTSLGDWDYLKAARTLTESRCAVNLPSPALLVGCPLRKMHARKLVTTFTASIVESSSAPSVEHTFAPLLRHVTTFSNYYYTDNEQRLFLERDKRFTVLYGTIGGEVIGVSTGGTALLNRKMSKFRVLQLYEGKESDSTDLTLNYSLSTEIKERTTIVKDIPVESVPDVDSLKTTTIEHMCCFPVPNYGNLVAVYTEGGIILLFSVDIYRAKKRK